MMVPNSLLSTSLQGSKILEVLLRNGPTLFQVCPLRPFETSGIVGVVIGRIHVGGSVDLGPADDGAALFGQSQKCRLFVRIYCVCTGKNAIDLLPMISIA